MQAGRLDREITIQENTQTRSSTGGLVDAWTTFDTVRAEVRPTRAREFFEAKQVQAEQSTTFRIRWLAGITRQMRIRYDGDLYDIESVAEIGRREGVEIVATARVE